MLLHILFYSKIGTEQGQFTLEGVINSIAEKLIARHPHVYGDVKVESEEDVKRNWEKIKMKDGKDSVLSGVPASLPSVVKASRIQEKARQVGFEWEHKADVWKKVEEEMDELREAETISLERTEEEFGDLMFSLVNYARFLHIDAETALEKTNKKFIHRFRLMEENAREQGKTLDQMTLGEMDEIWNDVKRKKDNP
jgi:MazG family protein